jgi:hypothetical protein
MEFHMMESANEMESSKDREWNDGSGAHRVVPFGLFLYPSQLLSA